MPKPGPIRCPPSVRERIGIQCGWSAVGLREGIEAYRQKIRDRRAVTRGKRKYQKKPSVIERNAQKDAAARKMVVIASILARCPDCSDADIQEAIRQGEEEEAQPLVPLTFEDIGQALARWRQHKDDPTCT